MSEPFSTMWNRHIGRISMAKHRIESTAGANPIHLALYLAGPKVRKIQRVKIARMLEWKSSHHPQLNGLNQLCSLQKRTKGRHATLLSRLQKVKCQNSTKLVYNSNNEWMHRLVRRIHRFPTPDANGGYWHVETDDEDKGKNVFTSHHGLFWFIRMPFRLKNALRTFRRAMDVI